MTPARALLILIAGCAMGISYEHSIQPNEPESTVAQKSATECLASALNVSQLTAPQSRSKRFPMPQQFAQSGKVGG